MVSSITIGTLKSISSLRPNSFELMHELNITFPTQTHEWGTHRPIQVKHTKNLNLNLNTKKKQEVCAINNVMNNLEWLMPMMNETFNLYRTLKMVSLLLLFLLSLYVRTFSSNIFPNVIITKLSLNMIHHFLP